MENALLNWSSRIGVSSAIVTVGELASNYSVSYSLDAFVEKIVSMNPRGRRVCNLSVPE